MRHSQIPTAANILGINFFITDEETSSVYLIFETSGNFFQKQKLIFFFKIIFDNNYWQNYIFLGIHIFLTYLQFTVLILNQFTQISFKKYIILFAILEFRIVNQVYCFSFFLYFILASEYMFYRKSTSEGQTCWMVVLQHPYICFVCPICLLLCFMFL